MIWQPMSGSESETSLRYKVYTTHSSASGYDRTSGAIILRITHGYKIKEDNDPFITLADQVMLHFSLATAPGGFIVDLIPACMLLLHCHSSE